MDSQDDNTASTHTATADRTPRCKSDAVVDARMAQAYRDLEGQLGDTRICGIITTTLANDMLEGMGRLPLVNGCIVLNREDAEALLWMVHLTKSQILALVNAWDDGFKRAQRREAQVAS